MLRKELQLREADILAQSDYYRECKLQAIRDAEKFLSEVEAEKACFTLKDLAVNGTDLMTIGFKPGKRMGVVLNQLLTGVIEDVLPNDKEVLLAHAQKLGVE